MYPCIHEKYKDIGHIRKKFSSFEIALPRVLNHKIALKIRYFKTFFFAKIKAISKGCFFR